MLRSTKLLAVAFLGLGVLLGYAAASGRLNPLQKADAASPVPDLAPEKGAAADPACPSCRQGANKGELLALAAHNDAVKAKAEKTSKDGAVGVIDR